jgi:hypothetical protein
LPVKGSALDIPSRGEVFWCVDSVNCLVTVRLSL